MKKILTKAAAVITAAAAVFSLASCGGGSGDSDMTKISILYMDNANAPYKEDWLILKEIAERKNVELELQVVPGADYDQKRSILFSSGEFPDIVVNAWPNSISQYAKAGMLLPVSDYLDQLPNLKKIIDEWDLADTVEDISETDGKFYVLPTMNKTLTGTECFGIREDIFKKHNIPEPTTYEELYQAMKQLKELYPNSLGTGELYLGQRMMSYVAEAFGTNGGYSLPHGYSYNYDTEEWYFAPTSDQYKELLTFMNNMYKDGCLDPEGFTQDGTQYNQKVLNDQYFVMPINGPQEAKSLTKQLRENGETEASVKALYPLAGPTGIRAVKPTSKNQGGLAVNAKVAERDDFDKVLEFFDWLYYSEEGALLSTIGVEGVTYDIVDGKYQLKPEIKTPSNEDGTVSLEKDYGIGRDGLKTLVPDILPAEVRELTQDKDQFEFAEYIKENNMTTPDDPIVKFTDEQSERTQLLITTLNDYTGQMIVKFIFGQESLDNWDNYVEECKKKGSDELMQIVNEAWAAQQK